MIMRRVSPKEEDIFPSKMEPVMLELKYFFQRYSQFYAFKMESVVLSDTQMVITRCNNGRVSFVSPNVVRTTVLASYFNL